MRGLRKDEWDVVSQLFERLVDLAPSAQAHGIAAAKLPPRLAKHLRSMLAANQTQGLLDRSVPPLTAEVPKSEASQPTGVEIGGFVLDALIGRGGMGDVYLAHRVDRTFDQRVALKILRPSARADLFDRERRLLARLEHPGIARLIDGGIGPDNRPFMAMEFVEGLAIDQWLRERAADLPTRLRLFREVCDAVSYAHGLLVVHSDIKPSNILIDRTGRARLLDFGVAQVLGDALGSDAPASALTPGYAAPEQLVNAPASVASDIYSLGVVLYELLAEVGPWGASKAAFPVEIRRMLDENPAPPSRARAAISLPGGITDDLDAIVLKAISRNPQDRYRSAGEFSEDIERYLARQPVRARRPTRSYIAARFVQRYPWAVAASVATLLAVLAGSGGIAWQAHLASVERDLAVAEARRSEAVVRMLTVMFRDTERGPNGESATVNQMLDETAQRLVKTLDSSPRSARLIATIADLYVNIEDPKAADTLLREALIRGVGKQDRVSTAQLQLRLASSAAALNRNDEIGPLAAAADKVFQQDPARFRIEHQEVTNVRAQLARREGDYDTAIRLLMDSLPEAESVYAENHRDLLTLYNNLLVYLVEANRLDEIASVLARAEAAVARTGQQRTAQGLQVMQFKGLYFAKRGDNRSAERVFDQVVDIRRELFGKSAGMAVDLLQLARVKLALGKPAEALGLLREAQPLAQDKLGADAMPTLVIGITLAEALVETGQTTQADDLLHEVEPAVAASGREKPAYGILLRTTAIVRAKQHRQAASVLALNGAETIWKAAGPAGAAYLLALPKLRARLTEEASSPTK